MTSTKSADCVSLETALTDLWKQLERSEKRLNREEEDYIQTTMLHQTPPFGSLISGWEGILEGTKVDVHRGKERIYTRACHPPAPGPPPLFLSGLCPHWGSNAKPLKFSPSFSFLNSHPHIITPFHPCLLDLSPPTRLQSAAARGQSTRRTCKRGGKRPTVKRVGALGVVREAGVVMGEEGARMPCGKTKRPSSTPGPWNDTRHSRRACKNPYSHLFLFDFISLSHLIKKNNTRGNK